MSNVEGGSASRSSSSGDQRLASPAYLGQPISLEEIENQLPPSREPSLRRIGFTLAKWILILIGVVLLGIGVLAWLTYPTPDSIVGLAKDPSKTFDDYSQARTAWFGQIKDLVQLLVVSLLVPLLASVLGYIFGRQHGETDG